MNFVNRLTSIIKFLVRFLGTNSRFIPVQSAKECVDSMVTIAKVSLPAVVRSNQIVKPF